MNKEEGEITSSGQDSQNRPDHPKPQNQDGISSSNGQPVLDGQNSHQQNQQRLSVNEEEKKEVSMENVNIAELPRSTINVNRVSLATLKLRDADIFTEKSKIGQGTFGEVYKAKLRDSEQFCALKRIKMEQEKEGFPLTAIREIKILKRLNHPNIVKLQEIVTSKPNQENKNRGSVYLVFEYLEHDMNGILDRKIQFESQHIKCILRQLLEGVAYLHDQNIIHRDIKGGNLLMTKDGILKVADFGLARIYFKGQDANYTTRVVTLWYRAPEILLGMQNYTIAIDVWSCGCFFAELLTGKPLLPGRDEPQQLQMIYDKCGTPNEKDWPGVSNLRYFNELGPKVSTPSMSKLRHYFKDHRLYDDQALDLMEQMLALNPAKRISARQALQHPYFKSEPLPCEPSELPRIEGEAHEMTEKDARQRMGQMAAQNKFADQVKQGLQGQGQAKNEFYQNKNQRPVGVADGSESLLGKRQREEGNTAADEMISSSANQNKRSNAQQ